MQISNKKLIQTGFEYTPIGSTLDECMKWFTDNMDNTIRFGTVEVDIGLVRAKELELIDMLKG